MTTVQHYDALVIGAGQAGVPLATALAEDGRKTALIEREHVGGTCVNVGCTPTKTMVASARVAYLARRAADYGVHTGPVTVDMPKVRERKRAIVAEFRGGSEKKIAKTDGLDLIQGEARFIGPKLVEVRGPDGEQTQLSADTIFINTGLQPDLPTIPGLDHIATLNSTTIMELDEVPAHLLILGGGYIALEFGQMFRRFGSEVTLVERGKQLLAREDADVADEIAHILRDDGIDVMLNTKVTGVTQAGDGAIRLQLQSSAGERTVQGSHLLVATGRKPNRDQLNLAAAGVAVDEHGYIKVNAQLATNVPGIYALGDIKGGPAFTHISFDDFRVIRTNLIEHGHATTDRLVPYTVFIDPQLGRVGLSEQEARAQGLNIRVAKLEMSSVARALEVDETRGFMKAVVDADTQQILGCAILGLEGGEIMSVLQVAMMGQLPYPKLQNAALAHPTLAESLNNLFTELDEG